MKGYFGLASARYERKVRIVIFFYFFACNMPHFFEKVLTFHAFVCKIISE